MRIKVLVLADDAGSYTGKSGHVTYQQLALLDQDPIVESRMINSFDYRMSEDEKNA